MLNIYLTRHGQDEDNVKGILNGRRDNPLTNLGETQARELAEKIKANSIHFDAIYSSPLRRTRKTAEILAKALNLQSPVILRELIERDFGIMTGVPISRIIEMCKPDILRVGEVTYFLSPKGAETFLQLVGRAKILLKKIRKRHKQGDILMVTHGDIGKMIYASYYKLNWKDVLKQFHFGNSDLLLLSKESPAKNSHVFTAKQQNL